jgi:DNA-binding transcriptional ArsR family regulator
VPASPHNLQAEIFKVLAHPSRLLILDTLHRNEESFSNLMEITGLLKSNLSQQLSILQESGLIHCIKKGQNKHYSLADQNIAEVMRLVNGQLSLSGSRDEAAPAAQHVSLNSPQ